MGIVFNPLMEPVVASAIRALRLPAGSRGLDAGCGIGLQALLLAEAVEPAGHVTGLDISPESLSYAVGVAGKSSFSRQISFQQGDVRNLPFESGGFDWAWSSCCVGYAAFLDPLSTLRELARVVKPGGTVAIFVWSSEKLIPGYPLLEARLNATSSGIAPFSAGKSPKLHYARALGWFGDVGMAGPVARTFVGDAHAPLSEEVRAALAALFEMRWPGVEFELSEEDRAEYRRLCLPESPEFVLNLPDYYAFYTCSMFSGTVDS